MATTDAPSPPLDGDQGNGNLVIVTQVVMTSIALTLVLLRCCQMKILKAIKADDICIILGMVIDPGSFFQAHLIIMDALDLRNRRNVNRARRGSQWIWKAHVLPIAGAVNKPCQIWNLYRFIRSRLGYVH